MPQERFSLIPMDGGPVTLAIPWVAPIFPLPHTDLVKEVVFHQPRGINYFRQ